MAIEIDFSYQVDGFFDSVNYYRSETPMNSESMPAPTATGITGTTYTDAAAILGKSYYVRFGSVRNGIEKISEEITVDSLKNKVTALLHFDGNLTDETGLGVYSKTAGVTFTTEHAFNNQAIRISNTTDNVSTSGISTWQFGGNDFCIEFFLYIDSISAGTNSLITKWSNGGLNLSEFILCIYNSKLQFDVRKNDGSTYVQIIDCEQPPINQLVHIALSRSGNTFRAFYDGVKKAEQTSVVIINAANSTPVRIGGHQQLNWKLNGRIDEIRVTKGVARYTENFTPPAKPFY